MRIKIDYAIFDCWYGTFAYKTIEIERQNPLTIVGALRVLRKNIRLPHITERIDHIVRVSHYDGDRQIKPGSPCPTSP